MSVENTIFNRITNKNENTSTELLVNIMQYTYLRKIIIKWLLNNKITDEVLNSIEKDNVIPQKRTEENCQPDIQIKNSYCYILIENKIRMGRGLTDHEVNDYLTEIKKNNNEFGKLVFLLPDNYISINAIEEIKKRNPDLVIIKNWSEFLTFLYSQDVTHNNSILTNSLEYLSSIIDHTESIITNLSKQEVFMLLNPSKLVASYSLGEKICTLAKAFLDKNKLKYTRKQNDQYGIGYYFLIEKNEGNKECFIGLNPSITLEQKYVLSIATYTQYIDNKKVSDKASDGEWVYFPIDEDDQFILDTDNNQKTFNELTLNALNKMMNSIK